MATYTWTYDGSETVVLQYTAFPVNTGSLRVDCSTDWSSAPQYWNINAGASGNLSILSIRFKYGNGPNFTCSLYDRGSGTLISSQAFVFGVVFGSPPSNIPGYGLSLGDRNDLTPDAYQDLNTVQRWSSVGYQDGLYGRPAQVNLGTNQKWYDSGYNDGSKMRPYLNPYIAENH